MSLLQEFQEKSSTEYNKYVKELKKKLLPFKIGDKKEIYDDGHKMLKIAAGDVASELSTDDVQVKLSHYTDYPDLDGPYGFIRSYHVFQFVKVKCKHCRH